MNGWVIPAPAPWAKTRQACVDGGRSSSAETTFAPSPFSFNSCGLTAFISLSPRTWKRPDCPFKDRAPHSLSYAIARGNGSTEAYLVAVGKLNVLQQDERQRLGRPAILCAESSEPHALPSA